MRHIALTLILALLTTLCQAVEVGPYKVTKVVDGDTIKVMTDTGEQTVRILYVDTPETSDNKHGKKMPEGLKAKEFLIKLLNRSSDKNKKIRLYSSGNTLKKDRYNRILATPMVDIIAEEKLPNGKIFKYSTLLDVTEELILHGHSAYWRKYGDAQDPFHTLYKNAQQIAKQYERGIWKTAPKWAIDKSNERTAPKTAKQLLNKIDRAAALKLYEEELKKNPEHTHWLNLKSKKRHNKDCMTNFGTTKNGRWCTKDEGTACGMCGG